MDDHEGTPKIEYDDISLKTKLNLTRFGGSFGTLTFDEKSFFLTFLSLTPSSDYKPTNAVYSDSGGVYTSGKILNLASIDRIDF